MTDSFPKFDSFAEPAQTEVVGGDAYYTGDRRVEYIQPDPKDDGGYWEASDIPTLFNAPDMADILKRIEAIEKELKINKK